MDKTKVKMVGFEDEHGKSHKGIEDYLPKTQYSGTDDLYIDPSKSNEGSEHQNAVIKDIIDNGYNGNPITDTDNFTTAVQNSLARQQFINRNIHIMLPNL